MVADGHIGLLEELNYWTLDYMTATMWTPDSHISVCAAACE